VYTIMSDTFTITARVKEMLKQNAYLKEENQRLYDENKRLQNLLGEIECLLSPSKLLGKEFFVKSGFVKTPTSDAVQS